MAKQTDYNALLKYDPELNTIPLRKFKPVEMDLLFAVLTQVKDKGDSLVVLPFERLKNISSYSPTATKRFVADVYSVADKLLSLRFGRTSKSGLTLERFVLFTKFSVIAENTDQPRLEVQVFDEAIPLLNDLTRWVRFNYSDFVKLNSTYAKTMFRLLKQYRTTGFVSYKRDDFYELLSIPKSYRYNQTNLDARVLKPIKTELSPLFRGLNIKKIYSSKRGNPIKEFRFSFKPEPKNAEDIKRNPDFMLKNQTFNLLNNNYNNSLSLKEQRNQVIKLFDDFGEDYLELERNGLLPDWAKLKDENGNYVTFDDFNDDFIDTSLSNTTVFIDDEKENIKPAPRVSDMQTIRGDDETIKNTFNNIFVKIYDKWIDLFGVTNVADNENVIGGLLDFTKSFGEDKVLEVLNSIDPNANVVKSNFDTNSRLSYLRNHLLISVANDKSSKLQD